MKSLDRLRNAMGRTGVRDNDGIKWNRVQMDADLFDGLCDKVEAENEQLKELCATLVDDWMDKVCPTFLFCSSGGDYKNCKDETCGNLVYLQVARELGVEI